MINTLPDGLFEELQGRAAQANTTVEAYLRALIAKDDSPTTPPMSEAEHFLHLVSHELKSPLITIQGFVDVLEQDIAAGNTALIADDIGFIRTAAGAMQALLGGLLNLSRAGRLVSSPALIPLSHLTREAVNLVQGRIRARGVQVHIDPDMPTVFVDSIQIRQILQNLIENSVKFMGEQISPRIEIGIRQRNVDHVTVFVQDNGIGIDPHHHERVFGIFERLNPHIEGTGIGLALVKRIIDNHRGKIWIESSGRGHGTTFLFTLPTEQTLAHDTLHALPDLPFIADGA